MQKTTQTNWLQEAINKTPHGEVDLKINTFLTETGKSRQTFDRYRRTGSVPNYLERQKLKEIFNA